MGESFRFLLFYLYKKEGTNMELTRFEIDENVFEPQFKAKNIAFFKLIDSGKYEEIFYVYDGKVKDDDNSNDIISLITLKNGRPMSLPVKIFMRALKIDSINRNSIERLTKILNGIKPKLIEKRQFSKDISYKRVLRQTSDFWKKFNGVENISSLIYVLQNNGTINLREGQLRMEDELFYLKKFSGEKLISPQEAVEYMTNYLNEKAGKLEPNVINFLVERYGN
jgi:hypothetical protein